MAFTKEMQDALRADANETGEDHTPIFFSTREDLLAAEAAKRYSTPHERNAFIKGAQYVLTGY